MRIGRRFFMKSCAALGAAGVAGRLPASDLPEEAGSAPRDGFGVLVDTTRCIGCRTCETSCAEANGLPEPDRAPREERFTIVRTSSGSGEEAFAKTQCMHCNVPACASACPVKALEKTEAGPVVYHTDRCIGCRYCMIACPFGVPKYTYDKAVPYVRKCTMCAARLAEGKVPACVENCPAGAIEFGRRSELLLEAKRRVFAPDSKYHPHVYGEHEAGGTAWLYVSDRPLSEFGLPSDVAEKPYYEYTRGALGAVPFVITLWPPLLMGLYAAAKRRDEVAGAEEDDHA